MTARIDGLIIDSFAGGGGASTGITMALGRSPDMAINHDAEALALHAANHPDTKHYSKNIWQFDPLVEIGNRPVALAWFSPDCKHFSKAKGGKPVKKNIRDLAWVVIRFARQVRPTVIMLENVEEFQTWGPLKHNDAGDLVPDPERRGQTFRAWTAELRRLGYRCEWRELRACDFGAPTIRKRFFMVARRDGKKIAWPKPTHGDPKSADVISGKLKPWRTAAQIINWSLPYPSIFLTKEEGRALGVKRPLEPATMARIAKGVDRYVIKAAKPFIVNLTHQAGNIGVLAGASLVGVGGRAGQSRPRGADEPTATGTTKADTVLVAPHITKFRANSVGSGGDEPIPTVTANSYIKRPGGAVPLGVVSAFMAQHTNNRGVDPHPGHSAKSPVSTITSHPQQGVVATHMIDMHGSDMRMAGSDEPLRALTAQGYHAAQVAAFLTKYYGTGDGTEVSDPMHTATTKDRFGLIAVEIEGEPYVIADIGMRMLTPRELFRAQGFPDSYIIDPEFNGKKLTKTAQIRMCGNSVCPQVSEALVRANLVEHVEHYVRPSPELPNEMPLWQGEAA
jgi:DNA (cytosine-5)-methyltransferase 1